MREKRVRMIATRALAALSVAVVLMSACAAPQPRGKEILAEATPTYAAPKGRGSGGVLRILYAQAPSILNPHLATGSKDFDASRIVYEPLASFDKQGQLVPVLAERIPTRENGDLAADGRSVTWHLKQGVKWSDGVPFIADDVLFTYQYVSNPKTGATTADAYTQVQNVEVVGDYAVKVTFKDVNPAWALPFVGSRGMIIPRHVFQPYNNETARNSPANMQPVGTGPYEVVSFTPQEVLFLGNQLVQTNKIVFQPNSFYREPDKPYFARVELKGGGDVGEAAYSALKSGDVDYAWNLQVDPDTLKQLAENGKGRVIANRGPNVERMVVNLSDPNKQTSSGERSNKDQPHPILGDLKVREALALAIDRAAIAKLYPEGTPATNLLVAPPVYNSPNLAYGFDPEQAKKLLDEAGWKDTDATGVRQKDGKKLSFYFQTSSNSVRQQTQQIIKQNLAAIGVEVRPAVVDSQAYFSGDPNNTQTLEHFYADLEMYQSGNQNPDPGSYMRFWTCDQIPQQANRWSGQNVARWCNPDYDKLYSQSATELDPKKRQQLMVQMNDMVVEAGAVIPLVNRAQVAGVSKTLTGLDPTPWDGDLWNIQDWRRNTP